MKNKAYVITVPCGGKSTFVRDNNGHYNIMRIYDVDSLAPINSYQPLYDLPDNSCILGGSHKPNMQEFIYAVVLPSDITLIRNVLLRIIESPTNGWPSMVLSNPQIGYYTACKTAEEYNIPIFKTFEEALDYIVDLINKQSD